MDDNITKDKPLTSDYHQGGKTYNFTYYEMANYTNLDSAKVQQIYGVCFYKNEMVIVQNGSKNTWGLVGGKPEKGESLEETLKREIKEETNMQLLRWRPIGVQEVKDQDGNISYQLRVACKVKPLGEFVADPAGTITQVKLIDPTLYKDYFDWGEIGEKIIQRAIQLRPKL